MIEVFNFHLDFFSRYASLYFCAAIEQTDNELVTLEVIHRYVELLDKYFGSVSAFDFNLILTLYSDNSTKSTVLMPFWQY